MYRFYAISATYIVCFHFVTFPPLIISPVKHASSVQIHCIDGTLHEYSMQDNQLLERAIIDCPCAPFLIVPNADRESLLVTDWDRRGQVTMMRKVDAGKWAARRLLDDPQLEIDSMCTLDSNTLSLFDRKSSALRIYEFAHARYRQQGISTRPASAKAHPSTSSRNGARAQIGGSFVFPGQLDALASSFSFFLRWMSCMYPFTLVLSLTYFHSPKFQHRYISVGGAYGTPVDVRLLSGEPSTGDARFPSEQFVTAWLPWILLSFPGGTDRLWKITDLWRFSLQPLLKANLYSSYASLSFLVNAFDFLLD